MRPLRSSKPNVCVVGAGAVGLELIRILKQRRFPLARLTVLARSTRALELDRETVEVQAVRPEAFEGQDLVLFAGTEGEKGAAVTYAPEAIRRGAIAVDNGSDFRLDARVPLVVPEVNPGDLQTHENLIANPNCSTIQMVLALHPLQQAAGIRRVIVSTYQAASGAGREAVDRLKSQSAACLEERLKDPPPDSRERCAFNVTPRIGQVGEAGYSTEEWKLVRETRKILHAPELAVTATAVRVPVFNGHAESVYVELESALSPEEAVRLWERQPGIAVSDSPDQFPTPVDADGRDEVFIGRIRLDPARSDALVFWVVCDNLRKGAALNAVQIAEALLPGAGSW